jgi:hypothetical protein
MNQKMLKSSFALLCLLAIQPAGAMNTKIKTRTIQPAPVQPAPPVQTSAPVQAPVPIFQPAPPVQTSAPAKQEELKAPEENKDPHYEESVALAKKLQSEGDEEEEKIFSEKQKSSAGQSQEPRPQALKNVFGLSVHPRSQQKESRSQIIVPSNLDQPFNLDSDDSSDSSSINDNFDQRSGIHRQASRVQQMSSLVEPQSYSFQLIVTDLLDSNKKINEENLEQWHAVSQIGANLVLLGLENPLEEIGKILNSEEKFLEIDPTKLLEFSLKRGLDAASNPRNPGLLERLSEMVAVVAILSPSDNSLNWATRSINGMAQEDAVEYAVSSVTDQVIAEAKNIAEVFLAADPRDPNLSRLHQEEEKNVQSQAPRAGNVLETGQRQMSSLGLVQQKLDVNTKPNQTQNDLLASARSTTADFKKTLEGSNDRLAQAAESLIRSVQEKQFANPSNINQEPKLEPTVLGQSKARQEEGKQGAALKGSSASPLQPLARPAEESKSAQASTGSVIFQRSLPQMSSGASADAASSSSSFVQMITSGLSNLDEPFSEDSIQQWNRVKVIGERLGQSGLNPLAPLAQHIAKDKSFFQRSPQEILNLSLKQGLENSNNPDFLEYLSGMVALVAVISPSEGSLDWAAESINRMVKEAASPSRTGAAAQVIADAEALNTALNSSHPGIALTAVEEVVEPGTQVTPIKKAATGTNSATSSIIAPVSQVQGQSSLIPPASSNVWGPGFQEDINSTPSRLQSQYNRASSKQAQDMGVMTSQALEESNEVNRLFTENEMLRQRLRELGNGTTPLTQIPSDTNTQQLTEALHELKNAHRELAGRYDAAVAQIQEQQQEIRRLSASQPKIQE